MEPAQFYKFLQDPNLKELIEILKITDDIFDITELRENQRSDMLAWCLNPNEGHGQGDLILKDFLLNAYDEQSKQDKKSDNYKFLSNWTPGKTMATGFSSAFVTREFYLEANDRSSRFDIFIVDVSNKIFIIIENKAGARLKEQQLEKYTEDFYQKINNNLTFKNYKKLFVVIDNTEKIDPENFPNMGRQWIFMDYDWLKPAANRARTQVARGNNSAQLLMAYCQLETGWESDIENKISELALKIINDHQIVVDYIKNIKRKSITDLNLDDVSGINGEIHLFAMQYTGLCKILLNTQAIDVVKNYIEDYLRNNPGKIIYRSFRTKIHCTIGNIIYPDEQGIDPKNTSEWPLLIRIEKISESNGFGNKLSFNSYLIIKRQLFLNDAFGQHLTQKLSEIDKYKELSKFQEVTTRKILLDKNLPADKVSKAIISHMEEIGGIVNESTNQYAR